MRTVSMLLVALTATGAATLAQEAVKPESAKADMAKLQGKWRLVISEIDGKNDMLGIDCILAIDGHAIEIRGAFRGSFTIDPAKTPKQLDFARYDRGENQKTILKCIYRVSDAELVLCLGDDVGLTRPQQFITRPKDGHQLAVFRRLPKTNTTRL